MTRAIAEFPGLGWTTAVDPRFAQKSFPQLFDYVGSRISENLDPRTRQIRKSIRQEGPALMAIHQQLEVVAPEVQQFVQIGAHDGVFDDPFGRYIDTHGWNALLVEPQQEQHRLLADRYSENGKVKTRRVAISQSAGEIVLHRAIIDSHLEHGSAVASTDLNQVRKEIKRCLGLSASKKAQIVPEVVPAITLRDLFESEEIKPSEIDLFATDTEGHDISIVRNLVGWLGARPRTILYEHLHAPKTEQQGLEQMLSSRGYQLIKTHKDTLAVKSSNQTSLHSKTRALTMVSK